MLIIIYMGSIFNVEKWPSPSPLKLNASHFVRFYDVKWMIIYGVKISTLKIDPLSPLLK